MRNRIGKGIVEFFRTMLDTDNTGRFVLRMISKWVRVKRGEEFKSQVSKLKLKYLRKSINRGRHFDRKRR